MPKILRKILIGVAAAAAVVLLFMFVYSWLLPKLSYRQLVNTVIPNDAVITAKAEKDGEEAWLTDRQILAVVSWLAEYRSENNGIKHAPEGRGARLTLHFPDPDGKAIVLYLEPRAIVFEGIGGSYRITVDNNDIYDLISSINDV